MKIVSLFSATFLACFITTAQAQKSSIVDTAFANPQFSTLVKALQAAGLADALNEGAFTVFAPTNEAFDKLPKGTLQNLLKPANKAQLAAVLKYHVVGGRGVSLSNLLEQKAWDTIQDQALSVRFNEGRMKVNEATLLSSDIECSNGVIHVIDSVLLPPTREPKNIVETAVAAGQFNTLLAAAKAAGLVEALSGEGPFTLFAPTDAAFAKIPKHTLEDLLKPANKAKLVNLLQYHVVSGDVSAGDALNAGQALTLNGQTVPIAFKDGALRVQWAKVLSTDVPGGNGRIHVIDSVMLPPGNKAATGTNKVTDTASRMFEDIAQAIHVGVPMYNGGDAAGCAKVYMKVSRKLMQSCQVPKAVQATLRQSVSAAEHSSCVETQAWALRRGLDHAAIALHRAMKEQQDDS